MIVSASGAEVVEPIGQMLGADRVVATRMEIVDGKYTGNIDYYAYAEEKARAIEHLAETVGYDLAESYAYSDSVTDVHMLEVVGHPFAVNPDRELRRIATANEWPVLSFVRPVALRRRDPAPARQADPRGARRRRRGRRRRRHLGQPPQADHRRLSGTPRRRAKVNPCRCRPAGVDLTQNSTSST